MKKIYNFPILGHDHMCNHCRTREFLRTLNKEGDNPQAQSNNFMLSLSLSLSLIYILLLVFIQLSSTNYHSVITDCFFKSNWNLMYKAKEKKIILAWTLYSFDYSPIFLTASNVILGQIPVTTTHQTTYECTFRIIFNFKTSFTT